MSTPRPGPTLLAAFVVAMTLFAGCGKPQATVTIDPVKEAIAQTPGKVLHGRVLTDEVVPLGEARVDLLDGDGNVTTDLEGGYLFSGLESRDYLVRVSMEGYYTEVQRAAMMLGRDFKLDFFLSKMPTGEPQHATQVFNGFIACQIVLVTDFPGTMRQDCGAADPNNKRSSTFTFNEHSSGFVAEIFWDPTHACASTLDFGLYLLLDSGLQPLAEKTVVPAERIHVPPAYFAAKEKVGGEVNVIINADRCNGVTGPGLGVGAVAQQGFDVHFTAFYFEGIPDEFSIKGG